MYTITINFPSAYVNDSDYVELELEFTVDLTGTNQSWQASDKSLEVIEYGKLTLDYDIEDPLLVPSEMNFAISDKAGYLDGLLFGSSSEQAATEKQFKATLLLNGSTEFVGYVLDRSIKSDIGKKEVRFTALPSTDVLNQALFNENGEPQDPFGYLQVGGTSEVLLAAENVEDGRVNIRHSSNGSIDTGDLVLIYGGSGGLANAIAGWHYATRIDSNEFTIDLITNETVFSGSGAVEHLGGAIYRLIRSIIEDAYQTVNASIAYSSSLSIIHDWLFTITGQTSEFTFDEVYILDHDLVAGDTTNQRGYAGIVSIKDMLKTLALQFGAFTGMLHEDKAFFHKLFYYDSSNTQNLDVAEFEKGYRFGLLDYVRVRVNQSEQVHYDNGTFTDDDNKKLTIDEVIPFCYNQFGTTGSNMIGVDGGNQTILQVKDPSVDDTYDDNGQILADFWYNFRGNIANCRVDKLTCRGINYDYLKGSLKDTSKYQIIKMVKNFERNETVIDAIYLGETA